MKLIYNTGTDPFFNLAAEKYFLENSRENIFMLWRNCASVIIGRNQNTWEQINLPFVKENGIKVARRITGGGAVFHDTGNVNYSFIIPEPEKSGIDFSLYCAPVIGALCNMGIPAELNGRNDITADGFKISGNAQCQIPSAGGKKALLHHGTLLFSADLSKLSGALKVSPEKLRSKGIGSVASRVKNITGFESYTGPSGPEDFIFRLFDEMFPEKESRPVITYITEEEKSKIGVLEKEVFSTWEWNFGASPDSGAEYRKRFPFGEISARCECKKGRVYRLSLSGDFFGSGDISRLGAILTDAPFEESAFLDILSKNASLLAECINGAVPDDLISLFFR